MELVSRRSPMTKRQSRRFWESLVQQFEGSGERQERFAMRNRVALGSFRYWLYRIRAEGRRDFAVRVLPVRVAPRLDVCEGSLPALIDVLVSGAVLRIAVGTDPEYVGRLAREIGGTC
jgi:hypothetical protein